jgi:hypothetical protein
MSVHVFAEPVVNDLSSLHKELTNRLAVLKVMEGEIEESVRLGKSAQGSRYSTELLPEITDRGRELLELLKKQKNQKETRKWEEKLAPYLPEVQMAADEPALPAIGVLRVTAPEAKPARPAEPVEPVAIKPMAIKPIELVEPLPSKPTATKPVEPPTLAAIPMPTPIRIPAHSALDEKPLPPVPSSAPIAVPVAEPTAEPAFIAAVSATPTDGLSFKLDESSAIDRITHEDPLMNASAEETEAKTKTVAPATIPQIAPAPEKKSVPVMTTVRPAEPPPGLAPAPVAPLDPLISVVPETPNPKATPKADSKAPPKATPRIVVAPAAPAEPVKTKPAPVVVPAPVKIAVAKPAVTPPPVVAAQPEPDLPPEPVLEPALQAPKEPIPPHPLPSEPLIPTVSLPQNPGSDRAQQRFEVNPSYQADIEKLRSKMESAKPLAFAREAIPAAEPLPVLEPETPAAAIPVTEPVLLPQPQPLAMEPVVTIPPVKAPVPAPPPAPAPATPLKPQSPRPTIREERTIVETPTQTIIQERRTTTTPVTAPPARPIETKREIVVTKPIAKTPVPPSVVVARPPALTAKPAPTAAPPAVSPAAQPTRRETVKIVKMDSAPAQGYEISRPLLQKSAPVLRPQSQERLPESTVTLSSERTNQLKELTKVKVTVNFKDAEIADVIRILAEKAELNVVSKRPIDGQTTVKFDNIPVGTALDILLKSNGYSYQFRDNIIWVFKRGDEPQETRVFFLKNADAADLLIIVNHTLNQRTGDLPIHQVNAPEPARPVTMNASGAPQIAPRPAPKAASTSVAPIGNVQLDPRSNSLIVTAPLSKLDEVERLIEVMDNATQQGGRTEERIFNLKYIDRTTLERAIKMVLPRFDPKTQMIDVPKRGKK